MVERRNTQRMETLKAGSVSFGVVAFVDCTIHNMSSAGACLEFSCRPVLPKDFSMVIKPEYIRRTCRVAWQSGARVGVAFTGRR
jgi:hypothetical protein